MKAAKLWSEFGWQSSVITTYSSYLIKLSSCGMGGLSANALQVCIEFHKCYYLNFGEDKFPLILLLTVV